MLQFEGVQESDLRLTWSNVSVGGVSGWVAMATINETPLIDAYIDTDWGWCWRFVLFMEGGLSEDRNDLGGVTKFGISQRAYPEMNIPKLILATAKQLYYRDYWLRSGAFNMPWPSCLQHYDFAVNAGVGAAHKAYSVAGDDPTKYAEYRREYYDSLNGQEYQHKAWRNRVLLCENEVAERKMYAD